jgi:AcrR family transcriptional regulator
MARTADPSLKATILQAAREVFAEKGYAAARMSDIAKRADIAVGTIYLYFKNKEAMCSAFGDIANQRILGEALPLLNEGDLATAIASSLRASMRVMEEEKDIMSLLYLNIGFGPFENYQPTETDMAVWASFQKALQTRMDTGECRVYDTNVLTQLISNLVERTAVGCLLMGSGEMKDFEEPLIAFVQHALVNPDYKPKKQTTTQRLKRSER